MLELQNIIYCKKKTIEDSVYIYDAIRVPIGKANGIYKHILPEHLAAFLIQKLIERNNLDPDEVQEVILANAFGTGGNMTRFASLSAGLPNSIRLLQSILNVLEG